METSEIIRLAESPVVTLENLRLCASRIAERWFEFSIKYPPKEYDIISASAVGIKELARIFEAKDGFAGVEVEKISIDQQ